MPNQNDIIIRRAQAEDAAALQRFIQKNYGIGADFKGPDRIEWQFLNNPATEDIEKGATMWLALRGNLIVGQMGVQDCKIYLDQRAYTAGWIVDVMVDAECRGMGVGHALHSAIMKERPILMTLTMAEATRRIAAKAGCLTLAPTRQWIRAHNVSYKTVARFLAYKAQYGKNRKLAVNLFIKSMFGPWLVAASLRTWARFHRNNSTRLDNYEIEEFQTFDADFAAFVNDVQKTIGAIADRSPKIVTWRYNSIPQLKYRKFLLRKGAEIRGCLICRICDPAELPAGIVTDVIAYQDDDDAHDALLELAQSVLNSESEFLEAAASTPQMSRALKRAGFIATRTMRPTIVCSDTATRAILENHLDDWHFTKADHDWDQIHPV